MCILHNPDNIQENTLLHAFIFSVELQRLLDLFFHFKIQASDIYAAKQLKQSILHFLIIFFFTYYFCNLQRVKDIIFVFCTDPLQKQKKTKNVLEPFLLIT